MGIPSGWELVLVVVVIVLLFGARKLPDAARGLGRSLRIFKAEIKDPNDEEGRDADDELPPAPRTPSRRQAPAAPVAPAAGCPRCSSRLYRSSRPVPVPAVQPAQPAVADRSLMSRT